MAKGPFLRCRNHELLKLWGAPTNEQMAVEMTMKWKNPCTAHWMNQWNQGFNESMNQSINESTNQQTNDSVNQWANESMYQRINESMNQWINGSTLQWANESLTNESVNQRTNERMNQEISVSMKQATNNKSMNQRILPTSSSKSAPVASVFVILTCKLNSRYSLVRVLPTWFAEVLRTCQFYRFSKEIELSLPSGAHFADVIFQNCHVPAARNSCLIKIELSWQSRALFGQQRGPQSQKQRPYMTLVWRPQEPHYPQKNAQGSRARVFSTVNSHASELRHFPPTRWWVVDMLM